MYYTSMHASRLLLGLEHPSRSTPKSRASPMVRSSAFKHTIRSSTTVAASSRQPIAPSTPSQSARRSPSQRGLLTAARSSQPFHSVQRHAYATESIPAPDIVELYAQRVARGELERDEQQLRAVYELRKVQRSLIDYTPSARLVHLLNTMKSAKSSSASSMPSLTLPDWLSRREMQEVDEMSDRQRRKAIVHVLKGEEELLNLQTPTGASVSPAFAKVFSKSGAQVSCSLDRLGPARAFYSTSSSNRCRRRTNLVVTTITSCSRSTTRSLRMCVYRSGRDVVEYKLAQLNRRGAELDAEEAMMQLKSTEGGGAGYPWSRREEAKAQAITKGWRSVFAGARTR